MPPTLPSRRACGATILAITLLLAVAACSDASAPAPVEPGHFRASVSGGARVTLAGSARHRPPVTGEPFVIELLPAGEEGTTQAFELFLEAGAGPPVEGTHDVAAGSGSFPPRPEPGDLLLVVGIANATGTAQLLLDPDVTRGTVRLTRAGPDEWAGQLTVTGPARWTNSESTRMVRLSVEFRSAPSVRTTGRVEER